MPSFSKMSRLSLLPVFGRPAFRHGSYVCCCVSLLLVLASGLGCSTEPPPSEQPEQPEPCKNPVSLADGYVRCADGGIDRVGAGSYDPGDVSEACAGTEDRQICADDADCDGGPNGQCQTGRDMDGTVCSCSYACANDDECGAGSVCVPTAAAVGASRPQCVPAECTTAEECGPSGRCGVGAFLDDCGNERAVACRTPDDECADADDRSCGCLPTEGGDWECTPDECDT